MKLVCRSQMIGDVAVIRCEGRIVAGEEAQSLRAQAEESLLETKKFVLQLAGVTYVDSGGLGAIVGFLGTPKTARGDLKLFEFSPFLQPPFHAPNFTRLLPPHPP